MKSECDIIKDLLPLYADDVCSPTSREIVEDHLKTCPDCARVLKQLRASEFEDDLQFEKDEVIRRQALRFRRRSTRAGSVLAVILMTPVLFSLILELTVPAFTPYIFLIVLASMAVLGSLTVVPVIAARDKLFWTFLAFVGSLIFLLLCCFLQARATGAGWYDLGNFFLAVSAVLFGLSLIFLPFLVRARPLKPYMDRCNKAVVVIVADVILFANMMNMIPFSGKSLLQTISVLALCAGASAFMIIEIRQRARRG